MRPVGTERNKSIRRAPVAPLEIFSRLFDDFHFVGNLSVDLDVELGQAGSSITFFLSAHFIERQLACHLALFPFPIGRPTSQPSGSQKCSGHFVHW